MSDGGRAGRRVLAVDPGTHKCGLAVLEGDGSVVERAILGRAEAADRVSEALSAGIGEVVLGAGTGGAQLVEMLRPICEAKGVPLVIVDERDSSALARMLYFRENPPRWWRRIVPLSFQIPPRPYDDYEAVVIGRGYLEGQRRPDGER